MARVICPACKIAMPLITTAYGKQYVCSTCDMTHGAHQHTGEPLGIPADKETRMARMAAHNAFDPLWKSGRMKRREAYAWLAGELGIPIEKCHIGSFDLETCDRVSKLSLKRMYGVNDARKEST